MLKYYQVGAVSDAGSEIEAFLFEGFAPQARGDLGRYPFSVPFDWSLDPFLDRNWMFQLHGWRMLDAFFSRMSSGDVSYIGKVMTDWYEFYVAHPNRTPWYWYDMSMGLRASKIAYLLRWCHEENAALPLATDVLEGLLSVHIQHLTNPDELNPGNHGLFQLNGLMALLDALERTGRWQKALESARAYAIDYMTQVLKNQLGTLGVHTEDSPDYHFFVLSKIRQVLAAPWWAIPEMDAVQAVCERADVAKYWLVTPALRCPPVGDSAEGVKLSDTARLREWPHETQGHSLAAQLDGYAVVRSEPEVPEAQSHYLFFQGSFHTSGHKHADCLSFVWQEKGRYLLWDAGKYGYQRDATREYIRSTRSHNTVEIDERDFSRNKRDAYGSAIESVSRCGEGWLIVASVAHGRNRVEHRRVLFYRPGIGLDVLDLIASHKLGRRSYRLWWQLGPDAKVSVDRKQVRAVQPDGSTLVGCFRDLRGKPLEQSTYFGEEKPRLAGWVSREFMQYEPSWSVSALLKTTDRAIGLISTWRLDSTKCKDPVFVGKRGRVKVTNAALSEALKARSII